MKKPRLLHATRWLNLLEIDGWVFSSRRKPEAPPRIDALNLVALHEEGARRRLVVIEEWRVPVQTWEFGLPAGLIDPGEEPAACARRELDEETGLAVTWTGPLSGRLLSSAGMSDESLLFAFVGCSGEPSAAPGVEGEKIRVHLLDRAGCRALLERCAAGEAVISARLWPFLFAIAESGRVGAHEVG